MKYVRCNNCGEEYFIRDNGIVECAFCGHTDYTVIIDHVKEKVYPEEKDSNNLREAMILLKEELFELIKSYIDPWIK